MNSDLLGRGGICDLCMTSVPELVDTGTGFLVYCRPCFDKATPATDHRGEPVKNTYEVHTIEGVAFTVEADRMETNGADSALLYAGDELVAVCPLGRLVGIKRVAWTVTAPGGIYPKAS